MTFEQYVNSLDKKNPLYYVGIKYLREVWDAARTDHVKHMLYIALVEACETAEVSESIRKAMKAYEDEQ